MAAQQLSTRVCTSRGTNRVVRGTADRGSLKKAGVRDWMAPNRENVFIAPLEGENENRFNPLVVEPLKGSESVDDSSSDTNTKLKSHLSNFLFSGDVMSTVLEFGTMTALVLLTCILGVELDVAGSATFEQITWMFIGKR